MKTPFTTEQFFQVFESYNTSVFPLQLLIFLLGLMAVYLLHSNVKSKNILIGSFLGVLWLWMGGVYHIAFFSKINPASIVFGAVFIIQGLLILLYTFKNNQFQFSYSRNAKNYFGYFFVLFGLFFYPIIGFFMEASVERTISLGLPCPTTILTFGFFMLAGNRFPKWLLLIPSLWALIGLSAAINFGVYQDYLMIVAAIIADIYLLSKKVNNPN